jgi:predicted enzyme related to lactoylglutathione lyase
MHKSMLAGVIIDCQTDDLEGAATFWSQALGLKPPQKSTDPDDADYIRLPDHQHGLHIEVQTVKHPSRVHIDIQADDIEAEVARLEKLGAKRIQKIKRWVVMEAPTGQRFCVVRASSPQFQEKATTWD